ncbi:alanine and arginine-rich domain-containing protein [Nannospalax galili]|uniref:Alanine and arginine rich domain containing protein n=1 Tax=Nannospalax galili TaxID=1026970 RepID=A0A8C6W7U6_NANGA|nr:alanine and arginine-rich domain-containing protein [Nannospalax galili]
MGLGDFSHGRQRMPRSLYGVLGRAGLWTPVLHSVYRIPCNTWRIHVQAQTRAYSLVLEHLRRQLQRALQRAAARGRARRAREAVAKVAAAAAAVQEERSRARVECALARLRAELLELRFQNHQLARTLLDLNMKMQQLKKQQERDRAAKSWNREDDAMDREPGNA